MQSLALKKTSQLIDEWVRLRPFAMKARLQENRDHAARIMLAIEKELSARKWKATADIQAEAAKEPVRKPQHPDEFGYTEAGYREWMAANNPR